MQRHLCLKLKEEAQRKKVKKYIVTLETLGIFILQSYVFSNILWDVIFDNVNRDVSPNKNFEINCFQCCE